MPVFSRSGRYFLILQLASVLSFSPGLWAQSSTQAQTMGSESVPMGEVVDVFEVAIQVKVTDRDGKIVYGLPEKAFKLKEDGKTVSIGSFSSPEESEESLEVSKTEAEPGTPEPQVSETPATLVFLFDETTLPSTDRVTAVEQLEKHFRERLDGSVGTGLAAYDGNLRILTQPTDSEEELLKGLGKLGSGAQNELQRRMQDLALGQTLKEISEIRSQSRAGLIVAEEALRRLDVLARQVDGESQQQVALNRERYASFATLVEALGTQPGRKAIILISEGFPAFPGRTAVAAIEKASLDVASADRSNATPGGSSLESRSRALGVLSDSTPSKPRRRGGQAPAPRDMETLAAIAAHAGVGFYPWKSRVAHGGVNAEHGGEVGLGLTPDLVAEHDGNLAAALQLLADETGGRMTRGGALSTLIDQAVDDFSHFYTLTFTPPNGIDGRLHELKLKVKGRRLNVWHPRSYLAIPGS